MSNRVSSLVSPVCRPPTVPAGKMPCTVVSPNAINHIEVLVEPVPPQSMMLSPFSAERLLKRGAKPVMRSGFTAASP
ncbi:hypothetical protein D3C76_1260810 [compost metagenome]